MHLITFTHVLYTHTLLITNMLPLNDPHDVDGSLNLNRLSVKGKERQAEVSPERLEHMHASVYFLSTQTNFIYYAE